MSKHPWFRFYTEAVFDTKLRRQPAETRWLFVVCLSLARRSPKPGWLMLTETKPIDWDDLIDAAAMRPKAVERGMDDLQDMGVIEWTGSAWFVPNWDERQYESDSSTARVRKHRERKRNVSGNVSESDQRQRTETDNPPKSPQGDVVCIRCQGDGVVETGELTGVFEDCDCKLPKRRTG